MESSSLNEEEMLSDKLEKAADEYNQVWGSDEFQENLLQVIGKFDCGEISFNPNEIKFSNLFVDCFCSCFCFIKKERGKKEDGRINCGDHGIINIE